MDSNSNSKRKEVPSESESGSDTEPEEKEKEVKENSCFICSNEYTESSPKIAFSLAEDDCKKAGHSACSSCVLKIAMGNKKCPFCRDAMKKKAKKPKVKGVPRKGVEGLAKELMMELSWSQNFVDLEPRGPSPVQAVLLKHQELIDAAQQLLGPMEEKSFDAWRKRVNGAAEGVIRLGSLKMVYPGVKFVAKVPFDLDFMQLVVRGPGTVCLENASGGWGQNQYVSGDAIALYSRREEVRALDVRFEQAVTTWEMHLKNAAPPGYQRHDEYYGRDGAAEFYSRRDANYEFLCAQDPRFRQPVKADGKPLPWQFTAKDFMHGYGDNLGKLVRSKVLKMNDKVLLEAPWF